MTTAPAPTTLADVTAQDCIYSGPRPLLDWIVVADVHRDSDSIDRANWRSWMQDLGFAAEAITTDPDNLVYNARADACTLRLGHWLSGWLCYLLVLPESRAARQAEALQRRLKDYPVLDDEELDAVEDGDFLEIVRGCYSSGSTAAQEGDEFCVLHYDPAQPFAESYDYPQLESETAYELYSQSDRSTIPGTRWPRAFDADERLLCMLEGCPRLARQDASAEENLLYVYDSGLLYDQPSPQLPFTHMEENV